MGDLVLVVPFGFDGVFGGLGFWVPEGPGCGSLDDDSVSEYLTYLYYENTLYIFYYNREDLVSSID